MDYKEELIKYKMGISNIQEYYKGENNYKGKTLSGNLYYTEVSKNKGIFIDDFGSTLAEILKLDDYPIVTSLDNMVFEEEPINYVSGFLYHGIRFQDRLEKLEKIFKKKKILAGKYIDNYRNYPDNCNEGEYVSLFGGEGFTEREYDVFIKPNVSLVISLRCEALRTIYVSFDTWKYIKDKKPSLKNRFSYMRFEYQVKDYIPIEMVKAIGIPYNFLTWDKSQAEAELLKDEVIELMKKYDISLPIVDTSNINKILYPPQQEKIMKKI